MSTPSKFVKARNSRGEIQRIPRHWLDNPVLSAGFRVLASQAARDRVAGGPSEAWTVKELTAYAHDHGIDTTGLRSKAGLLDAIQPPADTPSPGEETPRAGDDTTS